jgi:hypothetical protein
MSEMWIGPRALAEATSVSTDTLRHYERLGLLPGTERTRAGYRRYPPAMVERVRLIQRALAVGFSLKDLGSALGQRDHGAPPCRRVRALWATGYRLSKLGLWNWRSYEMKCGSSCGTGMSAWRRRRPAIGHDYSTCLPAEASWNGLAYG